MGPAVNPRDPVKRLPIRPRSERLIGEEVARPHVLNLLAALTLGLEQRNFLDPVFADEPPYALVLEALAELFEPRRWGTIEDRVGEDDVPTRFGYACEFFQGGVCRTVAGHVHRCGRDRIVRIGVDRERLLEIEDLGRAVDAGCGRLI